jgi:hypothetical protein
LASSVFPSYSTTRLQDPGGSVCVSTLQPWPWRLGC